MREILAKYGRRLRRLAADIPAARLWASTSLGLGGLAVLLGLFVLSAQTVCAAKAPAKASLAETADARTLAVIFSKEIKEQPSPKGLDFDLLSVSAHITTKLTESTGRYDVESYTIRQMGAGIYRLEMKLAKEYPQDILYMEPTGAFRRTLFVPFWYGGEDKAVFMVDDAKYTISMGPKFSQAVVRTGATSLAAKRTTYDQTIEIKGPVTQLVLKIHYR